MNEKQLPREEAPVHQPGVDLLLELLQKAKKIKMVPSEVARLSQEAQQAGLTPEQLGVLLGCVEVPSVGNETPRTVTTAADTLSMAVGRTNWRVASGEIRLSEQEREIIDIKKGIQERNLWSIGRKLKVLRQSMAGTPELAELDEFIRENHDNVKDTLKGIFVSHFSDNGSNSFFVKIGSPAEKASEEWRRCMNVVNEWVELEVLTQDDSEDIVDFANSVAEIYVSRGGADPRTIPETPAKANEKAEEKVLVQEQPFWQRVRDRIFG